MSVSNIEGNYTCCFFPRFVQFQKEIDEGTVSRSGRWRYCSSCRDYCLWVRKKTQWTDLSTMRETRATSFPKVGIKFSDGIEFLFYRYRRMFKPLWRLLYRFSIMLSIMIKIRKGSFSPCNYDNDVYASNLYGGRREKKKGSRVDSATWRFSTLRDNFRKT